MTCASVQFRSTIVQFILRFIFGVILVQDVSSELSLHSFAPLHRHVCGMHFPSVHLKFSLLHRSAGIVPVQCYDRSFGHKIYCFPFEHNISTKLYYSIDHLYHCDYKIKYWIHCKTFSNNIFLYLLYNEV